MKQFECPYFDECGLLCNQTNENCRIKELFEDFYRIEKLYTEANAKCEQLKQENDELKKENQEIYKIGCENFVAIDQAKRLYKLNKCLDEIEEICTHETMNLTDSCVNGGRYFEILQKIKEVKGDE